MAIVRADEGMRIAQEHVFWEFRGKAVQHYASLEQSLCHLFANLSKTDLSTAGIIFFRITNTRARNAIIEKLFKKHFGKDHTPFLNSLIKQLPAIDNSRNEIVHWNARVKIWADEAGKTVADVVLEPPAYWNRTEDTPRHDTTTLLDFMIRSHFYAELIRMFAVLMFSTPTSAHNVPEDVVQTWRGIFLQPIVYPPPEAHPLFRKPPERDTPPPSSQE